MDIGDGMSGGQSKTSDGVVVTGVGGGEFKQFLLWFIRFMFLCDCMLMICMTPLPCYDSLMGQ